MEDGALFNASAVKYCGILWIFIVVDVDSPSLSTSICSRLIHVEVLHHDVFTFVLLCVLHLFMLRQNINIKMFPCGCNTDALCSFLYVESQRKW